MTKVLIPSQFLPKQSFDPSVMYIEVQSDLKISFEDKVPQCNDWLRVLTQQNFGRFIKYNLKAWRPGKEEFLIFSLLFFVILSNLFKCESWISYQWFWIKVWRNLVAHSFRSTSFKNHYSSSWRIPSENNLNFKVFPSKYLPTSKKVISAKLSGLLVILTSDYTISDFPLKQLHLKTSSEIDKTTWRSFYWSRPNYVCN